MQLREFRRADFSQSRCRNAQQQIEKAILFDRFQLDCEPAVTVVAPAIGNAVFNAVGACVRSLPITADAVTAAMKA
jgi:hypothetical protein